MQTLHDKTAGHSGCPKSLIERIRTMPMDAPDNNLHLDTKQPSNSLISSARRIVTWRVLADCRARDCGRTALLWVVVGRRLFRTRRTLTRRAILARVIGVSPPGLGEIGLLLDADLSPWNPRWFNYGSFPLYVLKVVQIVGSPFLGDDVNDIRVLGRAVSGLADIATILVVYGIASLAFRSQDGLACCAPDCACYHTHSAQPLLRGGYASKRCSLSPRCTS